MKIHLVRLFATFVIQLILLKKILLPNIKRKCKRNRFYITRNCFLAVQVSICWSWARIISAEMAMGKFLNFYNVSKIKNEEGTEDQDKKEE